MLQDHEAIPLSVMAPRQSYDELDDDLVVASATHDSQAPLIASSYNKQLPSSRFSSFKRIFQRPVAHPSLDTRPDRIVNPSLAFSKITHSHQILYLTQSTMLLHFFRSFYTNSSSSFSIYIFSSLLFTSNSSFENRLSIFLYCSPGFCPHCHYE